MPRMFFQITKAVNHYAVHPAAAAAVLLSGVRLSRIFATIFVCFSWLKFVVFYCMRVTFCDDMNTCRDGAVIQTRVLSNSVGRDLCEAAGGVLYIGFSFTSV